MIEKSNFLWLKVNLNRLMSGMFNKVFYHYYF